MKQAYLVTETDFDNKLINFNKGITSNKTKHLETQKKLNSLITESYKFFLGRICFTSNDGSSSTFVYQTALDTSESKKEKGTNYVLTLKSNGIYNSKLKSLHTSFLHSTNVSRYRIVIEVHKDPLAVGQNNYLAEIINIYIVYDLDAWPRNPKNNFKLINCLFGATDIVKNSDKEKY